MYSNLKIRINKFSINYLLIIACACFSLTPYLSRNMPRSIQVAIIAAWSISAIFALVRFKGSHKHRIFVIIIALWQMWEVLLRVVGYSSASWGNYFISIVFYCIIWMMFFIQDFMNEKQKKTIAFIVFSIIFINIISNIYLYYLYPYAHYQINNPWATSYLMMNVGTTPFYATILIYYGICFVILLNSQKVGIRLFSVLGMLLSLYFMTNVAPRATALSLLILMTVLILIDRFSKGRKLLYYFSTLLFFIMIAILAMPILQYLNGVVSSERLAMRIQDLLRFLQGNLSIEYGDGSFGTRIILAGTSIKTFTSSFISIIIGIGNHINVNALSTGIGQHSGFIDNLAKYGIIGGFFITYIFVCVYRKMKSLVSKKSYGNQILIIFLIFILYSFLNNSLKMEIGVVMFILLPLIPYLIDDEYYKTRQMNRRIS